MGRESTETQSCWKQERETRLFSAVKQLLSEHLSGKLMFKTRKVIAEIFSIVGAMRSSVRGIYFPEGRRYMVKVEPAPAAGLESIHCHQRLGGGLYAPL